MAERHPRLGLRSRLTASLALVVLAVAVVIGIGTTVGVRATLLSDFEERAIDQSLTNARLVAGTLRTGDLEETALLASLRPPVRSRPLLWSEGNWYAASLQVQTDDVPETMQQGVIGGEALVQRTESAAAAPTLVVGIPIEAGSAAYFEAFDLTSVAASLAAVGRTLVLVGAGATLLGAMIGRWVSGRVLRPVSEVTDIAERIAAGAIDARLDLSLDRDLSRLASSFNRMADALAERIAKEARFAADVSHELRSPLTTLVTAVTVLDGRRDELSETGREALALIGADVHRLEQTVEDLLEISRHDAGVVEVDPNLMAIGQAVRRILARLGHPQDLVEVAPGAVGATVAVDLRRLERVLANFIDNAKTHGGGATCVRVTADADHVRVSVEDRGPGVPPEDAENVFDRFARGVAAGRRGNTGGSGLGLALAAENAKLLRGRVFVDLEYHEGARLVLELPVVQR
jgi:two-component system sensor histidine kinase MtrB